MQCFCNFFNRCRALWSQRDISGTFLAWEPDLHVRLRVIVYCNNDKTSQALSTRLTMDGMYLM
jgi:hypothetical protein